MKKLYIKGQGVKTEIYPCKYNKSIGKYESEFEYTNPFSHELKKDIVRFDREKTENEVEMKVKSLLEKILKFPEINYEDENSRFKLHKPGESYFQWYRRFKAHSNIEQRYHKKREFERRRKKYRL